MRISSVRGPAPGAVTTPSVTTDDPATDSASPKLAPLVHQMIIAMPNTIRASHRTNRDTTAAGPTNERKRSLASKSGRRGVTWRAELLSKRATPRAIRADVTRGTTNEVKTFHTVSTTMRLPTTSATKRATSTAPSCQTPGRRPGSCVLRRGQSRPRVPRSPRGMPGPRSGASAAVRRAPSPGCRAGGSTPRPSRGSRGRRS